MNTTPPSPEPPPSLNLAMRRALALVRAYATGDESASAVVLSDLRGMNEISAVMAALAGLPSLAVQQRPDDVVVWCDDLLRSVS